MTDIIDEKDNEQEIIRRRKNTEGEGEQAGSGVAKLLTAAKRDAVTGERRHLIGAELIEAVVEFFSELPMRASATLSVTWEKTKATANAKAFAITNWFLEFGTKARGMARNLERARGADALGHKKQNNLGLKPGMTPTGPTGAQ